MTIHRFSGAAASGSRQGPACWHRSVHWLLQLGHQCQGCRSPHTCMTGTLSFFEGFAQKQQTGMHDCQLVARISLSAAAVALHTHAGQSLHPHTLHQQLSSMERHQHDRLAPKLCVTILQCARPASYLIMQPAPPLLQTRVQQLVVSTRAGTCTGQAQGSCSLGRCWWLR